MFFIWLLALSAGAIAVAAAYFSVYGLAYTFSGVFWSVVAMGAALEAGKLVATSYLYRYWKRTGLFLKTYLMIGIVALMVLTSTGIFGYLSTGYQQDVLPLKQKTEQVQLMEEERQRVLARKRQIDDIIAGNSGAIDATNTTSANTARTLRAATQNREALVRQYRSEQVEVTKRVTELDAQLLKLKGELIEVQAHIGPIIFVAEAFDLKTDDATKYLIFLIIFAFDPMAVALTLCVNIALRLRKEDKEAEEATTAEDLPDPVEEEAKRHSIVHMDLEPDEGHSSWVNDAQPFDVWSHSTAQYIDPEPKVEEEREILVDQPEPVVDEPQQELDLQPLVGEREPVVVEEPPVVEEVVEEPTVIPIPPTYPTSSLPRPRWNNMTEPKMGELVAHLRHLKEKQAKGIALDDFERQELVAIESILQRNGYDKYL